MPSRTFVRMSESYGYVCCTCFRDGLTTPPARPDIKLGLDEFGNIVIPETDPEAILEHYGNCVLDEACPHHHGRVVEEIFLNSSRIKQALGVAVLHAGATMLHEVIIERARYAYDGIIVAASNARAVIDEIDGLPRRLRTHQDFAYDLSVLRRLSEASDATANPVVWYYSGHSLGY